MTEHVSESRVGVPLVGMTALQANELWRIPEVVMLLAAFDA